MSSHRFILFFLLISAPYFDSVSTTTNYHDRSMAFNAPKLQYFWRLKRFIFKKNTGTLFAHWIKWPCQQPTIETPQWVMSVVNISTVCFLFDQDK